MSATATAIEAKRPRGRPRKTVDERDDGNRRHELLGAAAKLFRRQGFAATTTRDIAAAAGMQSGSPFYHFESKNALLYAVMEEGMQSAIARQTAALQDMAQADAAALVDDGAEKFKLAVPHEDCPVSNRRTSRRLKGAL